MYGVKNVMISKISYRTDNTEHNFFYYLNFNQSIKRNHVSVLYPIIAWHPQLLDAYYHITCFSNS